MNEARDLEVQRELQDYKANISHSGIKEGFYQDYKSTCSSCGHAWVHRANEGRSGICCRVCGNNFAV
jgi:hypothetical protein